MAFPLGSVREHWDQRALAKLEPKSKRLNYGLLTVGADACRSLIARFAE
jgi:hypothetical protein